jgi:hypothetical protein
MVLSTLWTLGVYMVRFYLGLPIHPGKSSIIESADPAQHDAFAPGALPPSSAFSTRPSDAGDSSSSEALVGSRAGALAASFSFAQVRFESLLEST